MTPRLARVMTTAHEHAMALRAALEIIYECREAGDHPPKLALHQIERLIEDCASHPAFATSFNR